MPARTPCGHSGDRWKKRMVYSTSTTNSNSTMNVTVNELMKPDEGGWRILADVMQEINGIVLRNGKRRHL